MLAMAIHPRPVAMLMAMVIVMPFTLWEGASCHSPCDLWELDDPQVVPGGQQQDIVRASRNQNFFLADPPAGEL